MTSEQERAEAQAIDNQPQQDAHVQEWNARHQEPQPRGQGTWGSNTDLRGKEALKEWDEKAPPVGAHQVAHHFGFKSYISHPKPPQAYTPIATDTGVDQDAHVLRYRAEQKANDPTSIQQDWHVQAWRRERANQWFADTRAKGLEVGQWIGQKQPQPQQSGSRAITVVNNIQSPKQQRRPPRPSSGKRRASPRVTVNVHQSQSQTMRGGGARTASPQRAPPSLIDSVFGSFGRMPAPTISRPRIGPGRERTRQVSILDRELGAFFPSGLPTNAKKRKKASLLYDDEFAFLRRRK